MFSKSDYINNNDKYTYTFSLDEGKGKVRNIVTYQKDSNGEEFRSFHDSLKQELESKLPTSSFSYAYKKNLNIKNALCKHVGNTYFLKLDIKHFFESINFDVLYDKIKKYGVDKETLQCCFNNGVLPIGFVTSPILSDFYLYELDEAVSKFAVTLNVTYTRYADDILLSTNTNSVNLVRIADQIGVRLGFVKLVINDKKVVRYDLTKQNSARFLGVNICKDHLSLSKNYILNIAKSCKILKILLMDGKDIDKFQSLKAEIIGKVNFVKDLSSVSYKRLLRKILTTVGMNYNDLVGLPFKMANHIMSTMDETELCIENNVLTEYRGKDTHLVIPEGVTELGHYCLENAFFVKSLKIPSTVTKISMPFKWNVYGYYYSLKEVIVNDIHDWLKIEFDTQSNPLNISHNLVVNGENVVDLVIPSDVTAVNHYSFEQLHTLKTLTVSGCVQSIGLGAFGHCNNLTKVILPSSLKKISDESTNPFSIRSGSFEYCSSLKEVCLANGIEEIGPSSFEYCSSLEEIKLPRSLKVIGDCAFLCSGLKNIHIPSSVENVSRSAFENCESLTKVEFEEGVKELGGSCFKRCNSLTDVVLPDSIEHIGQNCFKDCNNIHFNEYDNGLYIGTASNPFYYFAKVKDQNIKSCKIHPNCEVIANCVNYTNGDNYAFQNCENLESITIPASVKVLGDYSFANCSSLTEVIMEGTDTFIGDDPFIGCNMIKRNDLKETIIQVKVGTFDLVFSKGCYFTLSKELNKYGKEMVFFEGGEKLVDYSGIISRIIKNKIYKYALENCYDEAKNVDGEIMIKFAKDPISNVYKCGDDLFEKLEYDGYRYMMMNTEMKTLFGFYLGSKAAINKIINPITSSYDEGNKLAADLIEKYDSLSKNEINIIYNEALKQKDMVILDELAIFVGISDDLKENYTRDNNPQQDISDEDSDLPF